MADWREQISIGEFHAMYENGNLQSVASLGRAVADRLKTTTYFHRQEPEMLTLIEGFEKLDNHSNLDEYKVILGALYDFGDKDHRLWIETLRSGGRLNNYGHPMSESIEGGKRFKPYIVPETGPILTSQKPKEDIYSKVDENGRYKGPKGNIIEDLADWEFNDRLKARGIDHKSVSTGLYDYIKKAHKHYREWLVDRWAGQAFYGEEIKDVAPIEDRA